MIQYYAGRDSERFRCAYFLLSGCGNSQETMTVALEVPCTAISTLLSGTLHPFTRPKRVCRNMKPVTPSGLTPFSGGHADVNRTLSGLLENSSNNRLGFSMVLDDAGNLNVGWNSRTINLANPNFPGHTVPESMRQQVLDAIMQSTGRIAR